MSTSVRRRIDEQQPPMEKAPNEAGGGTFFPGDVLYIIILRYETFGDFVCGFIVHTHTRRLLWKTDRRVCRLRRM